jgi:outer membrane protein assembly factor BamB
MQISHRRYGDWLSRSDGREGLRWQHHGNLYTLEAESGALQWKFEVKSRIPSSPAVWEGIVYFGLTMGPSMRSMLRRES